MIRLLPITLAVFLAGCVGFSSTRLSEGQVEGAAKRYEKYVGDMHVLPSLDVHVEPLNAKANTTMVFPVPLYEGERASAGSRLLFFVSIMSKQPGQVLTPQAFAYLSPTGERFAPVSLVGPEDCGSRQPRSAAVRAPLPAFPLTVGRCHKMLVEFEAPTPDPSERFGFSLGALQSAQGAVTLPVVYFSQSTRRNTVAVP